jgi:hypothetical protein
MNHMGRSRTGVRLVAAALAVLAIVAVGCTDSDDESSGPATSSASDEPMLVVDVEALSIEEQLTFAALQGIVNRERPTLYLVGVRSAQDFEVDPSAEAWLADVVDVPHEKVAPDEALDRLLDRTEGMVVWDPKVPHESQNVATTIAGRDDVVPVSPEMADRLTSDYGLKVAMDLRDLGLATDRAFTEWAISKLDPPKGGWAFPVWTGRPRNGKAIQPGLRDWAVANRAFVFDADPAAEPGLLRQVLEQFPRGTGVYGYLFFDTPLYEQVGLPVNEALGVGELTERGDWLIPTTDSVNMTVHSHGKAKPRTARWDDDVVEPDDDATYVSFVVSDGDALGYDLTLARSLQFDHLGEASIPIGISTTPMLADVAPNIWNWYLDHLPDNARLVAGPSGSAYFYPSYAGEEDLDRFLKMSRTDLDATGVRSTWVINPPLTASPTDDDLAQIVDAYDPSILYADYTPLQPLSPVVSFIDDVPVVRIGMATKPDEIAEAIRKSIALQPDGPRFVAVGLVTWGTNAEDAAAALEQFGPDVVPVAPDRFAGLLRGAAEKGYTGSSDRPALSPPAPGACRADTSRVDWDTVPVIAAFLANSMFANDLPANATASGGRVSVDEDLLTAAVQSTFEALAPLAFGPDVTAGAEFDAKVTGLTPADDGSPKASGTLTFSATFDPGDGTRTTKASVPITCRPTATS